MMTTITVFHIDRSMFGQVRSQVDARSCWQAGLYKQVAVVECTGKEHAYMLTQNLDRPWHKNEGVEASPAPQRSTSVGDLICVPGEGYLLCKSVGWEHVDGIADYRSDDDAHLVSGEDQLSARSDRDMSDSTPFGDG